nr:reverse transcriptase domain-containing protein [Tanacetum cinerariifolium]
MGKKEARSPYLRIPPLKSRRKSIEFQGKNLYANFLHADCVDDHFDALDYWNYEDVYFSGGFDFWRKAEFSIETLLNDGGSSSTTYLSFVLKRKGKSKVKFTRKRAILKRSKMLSLRKGVRSHNVKAGVPKIDAAVILKKLPEKLGDPGRFLIPCGFSELKCKALSYLKSYPKNMETLGGLPDLIPTRMTLELANRAICTPDEITRDVFVPVGKFTFLADFLVVDYESDPRVPIILGRPFLRTDRALIDVYGEEMILRDRDERLTLNMKHDIASYSNHPRRDSVNLINMFNLSNEDCLEDLVSNKQSGNPTFSLHKEIASPKVIHEINDSKGCTFLSEELPDIDSFNDIHPHFD